MQSVESIDLKAYESYPILLAQSNVVMENSGLMSGNRDLLYSNRTAQKYLSDAPSANEKGHTRYKVVQRPLSALNQEDKEKKAIPELKIRDTRPYSAAPKTRPLVTSYRKVTSRKQSPEAVSYTHLTLPTIYSV
eukprot:TRINITY_DN8519_c0_g1_i3.p1 TRINITY_DN8519_c0_g1~~TRINITY_DN8519_c0_g1_i3.p1  ORF type:complete len:134 (+),score=18.78 TRINITY_DN8519_c0_g1_i3:526-927(+)